MSRNYKKIQSAIFFGFLLLFLGICIYMVRDFVAPILWAAILASIFYPVHRSFMRKVKKKDVSAVLTILVVTLIVLIPISIVAIALTREVIGVIAFLQQPETIASIAQFIETNSLGEVFSDYIENFDVASEIRNAVGVVGGGLLSLLKQGSSSVAIFFAKTFIMLYSLFFFLRDGKTMLLTIEKFLPFGDKNEREMYRRFNATSRATLKGSVLLAVIQGLIAGVGFYIVGFPSIAFFVIIAIFLSIIPAVGPAFLLIPSALYLFFTGSVWQAAVILGFSLIISVSENIIRPKLVGDDIGMHPLVFFFATIGGISLFGISGIIFGPIIASFLIALLEIYEAQFKGEIDKDKHDAGFLTKPKKI